ncbi:MAG: biotin transporter BioY [Rhodospirillales bacterium]|nr:biotin transporter BioY [Rhodospirillales bacterium]
MPASAATRPATLIASLWPARRETALLRAAVLVLTGSALLALSAHVQVPFWPVKLSMQSFVVLAIGLAYGSRLAGATILAYLAEGAFGLPVFQGGAGLAYMAGPTAGYLLGFLLAAPAMGALMERGGTDSHPRTLAAILLGEALIYAPGIAWLAVLFGTGKALAYGLLPFLPAEGAKMLLAAMLMPRVRRWVR